MATGLNLPLLIDRISSFHAVQPPDPFPDSPFILSLNLGRVLKSCQEIESDLRLIASESKRKHPEVKSLAERSLLKVGDYRDRREFFHRTNANNDDSTVPPSESSDYQFPTWNILSAVGAVAHVVSNGNRGMSKSLLHSLTLLQRLLSLWQLQQQSKKQRERCVSDPDLFEDDLFVTNDQLEMILKILSDQSGVAHGIHTMLNVTHQSPDPNNVPIPSGSHTGPRVPQVSTQTFPELESVQLKILQTVFLLLSPDTPLLTRLPNLHNRVSFSLHPYGKLTPPTSDPGAVDTPVLSPTPLDVPSLSPRIKDSSLQAVLRTRQLLALLVSLHSHSPFDSVRRTALAGLSQFFRFTIDSASSSVNDAIRVSLKASGAPLHLSLDEVPSVVVAYILVLELCRSSEMILSPTDYPRLSSNFFDSVDIINLDDFLDSRSCLVLLGSVLEPLQLLFARHNLFYQLLNSFIEPLLLNLLSSHNLRFGDNLRVFRLLQCYWLHISDVRLHTGRPAEFLIWIIKALDGLFDSAACVSWRRVGAIAFLRWLLEQPGQFIRLFSTEVAMRQSEGTIDNKSPHPQFTENETGHSVFTRLLECVAEVIHSICFSIGDRNLVIEALKCDSLRFPSNFLFLLLRLPMHLQTSKQLLNPQLDSSSCIYLTEINEFAVSVNESLIPIMSVSMSQWSSDAQYWQQHSDNIAKFQSNPLIDILLDASALDFDKVQSHQQLSTSTEDCPWSTDIVNVLLLRCSTETLFCIISLIVEQMLSSSPQQVAVLLNDRQSSLQSVPSSVIEFPIIISPNGFISYVPLSHPLSQQQSYPMNMLSIGWSSILAALSLLLNTVAMESGLMDLLLMSLHTLIGLSSLYNIDGCLVSTIQTISKIFAGGIRPSTDSISPQTVVTKQRSTTESDQDRQSTIKLSPLQLLCWKTLISSTRHFGTIMSQEGWKIILQVFSELFYFLQSYGCTIESNRSFKSFFTSMIDASLMDFIPSSDDDDVTQSSSDFVLLECSTVGLFTRSGRLLLTDQSLLSMLNGLGSLLINYNTSTVNNESSIHSSVKDYIHLTSEESLPSDSGILGYVLEYCYGIDPPYYSNNQSSTNLLISSSSINLSSFLLLRLVQVAQQNRLRLNSIDVAVSLIRPLKIVICGSLDKESIPNGLQLEAAGSLGIVISELLEACHSNSSSDDCWIKIQGIIFSSLVDIIARTESIQIKQSILLSLHTILRTNGLHIKGDLPWSLVVSLVALIASQCFELPPPVFAADIHRTSDRRQPFIDVTSFGAEQSNTLFSIVEIIIRDFRDDIRSPAALALLVAVITSMAQTHSLGSNVSFAAVGLLWTLAEAFSNFEITAAKLSAESNQLQNSTYIRFGVQFPKIFYTSINDYRVPICTDAVHNYAYSERNKTVLQIFNHLRFLASDSRVEVRNCSLRSLVAAYTTTAGNSTASEDQDSQKLQLDRECIADEVGLVLVGALEDISGAYQALMANCGSETRNHELAVSDPALIHHSRDSALKLWDESVVIILEGVFKIIINKEGTVVGNSTNNDNSLLLRRASTSLCGLLEALLTAPLTKTNDCVVISTDVYIVALQLLTRLALLSSARRIIIIPEDDTSARSSPLDSPKSSNEILTIRSSSVWERCWSILEMASDQLWRETIILDRLLDVMANSVESLITTLITNKQDVREKIPGLRNSKSGRQFTICVRILLILATGTCRPGSPLTPPTIESLQPVEFIQTILPINHTVTERLQKTFGLDTDTWESIKESVETPPKSNLDAIRMSLLFPSSEEWRLRSQQCHTSILKQPIQPITELFMPTDTDTQKHLDLDTIFKSTIELSSHPLFPPICESDVGMSSRPKHTSRSDDFDDDFNLLPSYLYKFGYAESSPPSSLCLYCNSSLPSIAGSMISSMKITRSVVPTKRLHSSDAFCIEVLECLPWEQLLLCHANHWIRLIYQVCESLLDPLKVLSHTSSLLISARTINCLTRILRRCISVVLSCNCYSVDRLPDVIGSGSYVILTRIFLLLRLSHHPSLLSLGFYRFAFESFLQILLDMRHLFSLSHIDVVLAVISLGINAACYTWINDISRGPSSRSSLGSKPIDVQLLRLVRSYIDIDSMSLLPIQLFDILVSSVDQFSFVGGRCGLQEMSQTSLRVIFDVCDCLSRKSPSSLPKLRIASEILCRRVRALLHRFIVDDCHSGQCPLPRPRLEEIRFVLRQLRSLRLNSSSLFNEETQDDNKLKKTAELAGNRSHIVVLLPDLVKLISAKDGNVRSELRKVFADIVSILCEIEEGSDGSYE